MRASTLRHLLLCAILLAAMGPANIAEAGAPTEMLRGVFADANRVLTDPATEQRPLERLVAIRGLFSRVFDFHDAAERSLGRQWQARTAAEQQEFTRAFADFVQRGFVYWLASVAEVARTLARFLVEWCGESIDGSPETAALHGGESSHVHR